MPKKDNIDIYRQIAKSLGGECYLIFISMVEQNFYGSARMNIHGKRYLKV